MLAQYADVCCASLPSDGLAGLATLRAVPGVLVCDAPSRIWVRWEAGDARVLQHILPLPGAVLYSHRGGLWYQVGRHLPAFEVLTDGEFLPLHQVLVPSPVQPIAYPGGTWTRGTLSLRPERHSKPTSAMICSLHDLLGWAESTPSCRLKTLRAAYQGGKVFVLGSRLPALPSTQRFWGERVLVPLGYRLEPELSERLVRECLAVSDDELLIVTEHGADVLRHADLRPVSRAVLRLATREAAP